MGTYLVRCDCGVRHRRSVVAVSAGLAGPTTRAAQTDDSIWEFGDSPLARTLNQFAFFTIQSNLIVGGTSLLLAIRPNRTSTVFSVFRLIVWSRSRSPASSTTPCSVAWSI